MTDHVHETKKRALIGTIAIMGSRLFGLVREQVFAVFFGAGTAFDAFIVAFRIPNLLRDLFAEGALSQSFVTIFSQKLAAEDDAAAFRLANKVATFILLTVGVFTILGMIFSPQIVSLIATGFTGEKFDLTVRLMRLLFPFILLVSLAALMMGMLNAKHKFFIPHSASTFFNVTSIVAGLIFAWILSPDYIVQSLRKLTHQEQITANDFLAVSNAIVGMGIGTLLGGLVQYVSQLPTAWRIGFRPRLDLRLKDPALIKVLKLTGPAILGGAAVQVNVLVNTEFASLLGHGAVSWLNYAFRFMQFPLGVFGVAIASATAPALARLISSDPSDRSDRSDRSDQFLKTIQSSIQLSIFLCLPATIGLIVLGQEIIALIYEHGHFGRTDTVQTAHALMAYALGITSYSLIKIYQPAFMAFHDAKTPMRISLLSIVANFAINACFILVFKWGHWSLALGTALVATLNIVLLLAFFRRNVKGIWSADMWKNLLKVMLAAVVMGALIWWGNGYIHRWFAEPTILNKLIWVFLPMLAAVPIYFGLTCLLKVHDARFVLQKILRKPPDYI